MLLKEANWFSCLKELNAKETTCIFRAALSADGMTKCRRYNCHELPSAFCQQLEMQMEAANPADVEQAFRVCAFRSVPVPFPFRSSFCVRAGLPCGGGWWKTRENIREYGPKN
jgi:hypothetical protein